MAISRDVLKKKKEIDVLILFALNVEIMHF